MRVTFIAPVADYTGGARVIHTYAKLLKERGHDVTVVTRPLVRGPLNRFRRMLEDGKWRPHLTKTDTYYSDKDYNLRFAAPEKPIGPEDVPDGDVVIATFFELAEWVAQYPSSKGKRAHFVQHYEVVHGGAKDRVDAALRLPLAKITISKWLCETLTEIGAGEAFLVPNSVDTKQFDKPPRRRQSTPTVGMVFSLVDFKDSRTGLNAFELLRRKMPEVRLTSFGHMAPRASLPLPADAKFVKTPPQSEIANIYASSDVWMCSSKSEGFGLPVLEAMACRCPVVSTAVGGPIDFLEDGVEGFIVPIEDAPALADRLERVLRMPEDQWLKMSEAAYRKAHSYTWTDATDRFEAALLSIVNSGAEAATSATGAHAA